MGAVLALRSGVLATAAVALGSLAHLAGGGQLPAPHVLGLLVLGVALGAAWCLAEPLRGPAATVRIVTLTITGQLLTHLVLGAQHDMAGTSMSMHMPMQMPMPGNGPVADLRSLTAGINLSMLAAHLGAAIVVGLWLAFGEQVLFGLLALLGWRRLGRRLVLVARPLRTFLSLALTTPVAVVPTGSLSRRGPPAVRPV